MGNYALTVAHCLQVPASRHVIKAAGGRAYANFQLFTNFFPDLLPILTGLSSLQQPCGNDAISHARTHAPRAARFPVPLHSFSLSSAPSIAVGRQRHWSSTRIQGWVDGGGMNHTDYPARQSAGVVYSGRPPRQFINRRLQASTGHHCSQAPAAAPSYRDSLPRQ